MKKRLLIFGPFPPPLGGISVHIKRLIPFLNEKKIPFTVFNHGFEEQPNVIATRKKLSYYLRILIIKNHEVFHFHQFFIFHFFYYFIFSWLRNKKIIITIHSERLLYYNRITKLLIITLLNITRKPELLTVSKNLHNYLSLKGIKSKFLPAYVPPVTINEVKLKDDKKIFLYSVWKFNKELANNVYNVPLAFKFLKENSYQYRMLLMIGNKAGSDLEFLRSLIGQYSIKKSINLIFDQNLVDYVKNCDFLLRVNLSDGYGVSLQEAMDLGTPAIASNVCERPKGTVLFENNDFQDLSRKIDYIVNTDKKIILQKKENLKYHEELIKIYLKYLRS